MRIRRGFSRGLRREVTGMPAVWVARAVVKAIRYDSLPGYQTISVPRPMGLARLDALPVGQWLRRAGAPDHIDGEGDGDTESRSQVDPARRTV